MTAPFGPADLAGDVLLLPEQTMLRAGLATDHAAVISGGMFTAVGPAAEIVAAHPHLIPLHLPRTLLMPGFIDAHHHLSQSFGKALAFGEPSRSSAASGCRWKAASTRRPPPRRQARRPVRRGRDHVPDPRQ